MDPPPSQLPPLPITPTTIHLAYPPDSLDSSSISSPRSSPTVPDTTTTIHPVVDHHPPPLLPPVPGAKVRLMCSYGGHIIPRPHDKSLCYVGGETRMVALDRGHLSLSSLSSRLSRTLLSGRSTFTLKYQLPNEELDSLVSVTTDEDLENMFEEYDRVTSSSSSSSGGGGGGDHHNNGSSSSGRIRLFLFFNKPETAASMGSLLDDAKSETWFVDALNGSGLLHLPRNLSDSATMDTCLVNLGSDVDVDLEAAAGVPPPPPRHPQEGCNNNNKSNLVVIQDLNAAMPDSPVVENHSSSSSSSSPCLPNLPPIQVRVAAAAEDQGRGGVGAAEEQLAQMSFAQAVHRQQQTNMGGGGVPAGGAGSGESLSRILSDDERSDQGVPVSFRKPPLPLPLQVQSKAGAFYNLPSPDSVASDTSIASAGSLSKPMYYQDQSQVAHRPPLSPDTKSEAPIPTFQVQNQQIQDQNYPMHHQHLDQHQHQQQHEQQQQQQYLATGTHFLHHPPANQMAMPSYYTVYAPPPQQQQQQQQQQQYPVYVMPMQHGHPYMSMQSNNMVDTTIVSSNHPGATNPNPSVLTTNAVYNDVQQQQHPPIYPSRAAANSAKADQVLPQAQTMYATAMTSTPSMIQIPASQYQNQYGGYSQVQYPNQQIAAAANANNYAYDYNTNVTHDHQVYYTHQQQQVATPPLPPQYQTMTPAAVAAMADTTSNQQQPPSSNISA